MSETPAWKTGDVVRLKADQSYYIERYGKGPLIVIRGYIDFDNDDMVEFSGASDGKPHTLFAFRFERIPSISIGPHKVGDWVVLDEAAVARHRIAVRDRFDPGVRYQILEIKEGRVYPGTHDEEQIIYLPSRLRPRDGMWARFFVPAPLNPFEVEVEAPVAPPSTPPVVINWDEV